MSFLENIKLNYFSKQLDDFLLKKNEKKIIALLEDLTFKNPNMSKTLSPKYLYALLSTFDQGSLVHNKIFWINSFDLDDTIYIQKFLSNYFLNHTEDKIEMDSYVNQIQKLFSYNLINELYDFESQINLSYLVQFYLLILNKNTSFQLLMNNSAFFESNESKAFTHPKLTQSYILIIKNPLTIYSKLKKKNHNAFIELLNLDNNPLVFERLGFKYEVNRKGWGVFNESWADLNVKDTFNGLIIKYEDLVLNTSEILVNLIFHLKQSGINLKIDYEYIDSYVKNNSNDLFVQDTFDLSKKEIKLLRNIEKTANRFGYFFE